MIPLRSEAIGTVLQRAQPDIVGLQEVWQHDQLHLAGELTAELGFHTAFAAAEDSSKWQAAGHGEFTLGNAILSRWPFESSEVVELPAGDKPNESRFALSAVILTPHGSMRFTTTHLNSGRSHNNIRAEQLRHMVSWLAEQPASSRSRVGRLATPSDRRRTHVR